MSGGVYDMGGDRKMTALVFLLHVLSNIGYGICSGGAKANEELSLMVVVAADDAAPLGIGWSISTMMVWCDRAVVLWRRWDIWGGGTCRVDGWGGGRGTLSDAPAI